MKNQHFLATLFTIVTLGSLVFTTLVATPVFANYTANSGTVNTNTNNNSSTNTNTNNNNNVNTITINGGYAQAQQTYYQQPYQQSINTLICTPGYQTVGINQTATLTATGGNGSYTWTVPELNQNATGLTFQVAYGSAGSKTVTLRSDSQTVTCSIQVTGGQVLAAIDFPNSGEGGIHAMNWGGILLALSLVTVGVVYLDRRRRLN